MLRQIPSLWISRDGGCDNGAFSNGQAEDITCEKDGEFGVTHYYDASGNEIVLNPGKTWICICTTNDMQPAKIEGK